MGKDKKSRLDETFNFKLKTKENMTVIQLVELNYKSIELVKILYKQLGKIQMSDVTRFNQAADAAKIANELREFVFTQLQEEKRREAELDKQAKEKEEKDRVREEEEMKASTREVESDMVTVYDSMDKKENSDAVMNIGNENVAVS